jgi:hypothetical protein
LFSWLEHLSSQSSQTKNRQLTAIGEEVVLSDPGSAALGIPMNSRGLMELVVLNVGLDLGVLSPTLFAMSLGDSDE